MVATKLMCGAWDLTPEQRGGLSTRQPILAARPGFVRCGLLRLRLGQDLTGLRYGGQPRGLAFQAEILARFPELALPA